MEPVVMGANLPAAAGAATTTAYSLSFVLIARAVFVPSTARHTAWLGLAVGIPLVIAVYVNFLTVNLEVWNGHGFFRKITDKSVLARSQSIQIGFAWALTTLDWGECERMVRINPGETGMLDLAAVVPAGVQLILIRWQGSRHTLQRANHLYFAVRHAKKSKMTPGSFIL